LEENLITDYADDTDLIGQEKVQKTQREIRHELAQIYFIAESAEFLDTD
jgi:hypothetical protein